MFENFVIVLIKPEINLNFNKHTWEMAIFEIVFKIFKFAKISVDLQNLLYHSQGKKKKISTKFC